MGQKWARQMGEGEFAVRLYPMSISWARPTPKSMLLYMVFMGISQGPWGGGRVFKNMATKHMAFKTATSKTL